MDVKPGSAGTLPPADHLFMTRRWMMLILSLLLLSAAPAAAQTGKQAPEETDGTAETGKTGKAGKAGKKSSKTSKSGKSGKKKKASEAGKQAPAGTDEEAPVPPRQPAPNLQQRLRELERRVAELEEREEEHQKELEAAIENNFARGIVTIGGLRFRLGGQAKFDFIDTESENHPIFGATESPDPHLEVDRFRLEPRVNFPRSRVLGDFSLRAQIHINPQRGDTVLKEATLDHELAPEWWLTSVLRFGLDDRFIRPNRLTQTYPLLGTAFWRDESVALFWEGTLGDKRGRPEPASADDGAQEGEPVPARSKQTRSTTHRPFDFFNNTGALKLHASISNGYGASDKEIGKDDALFDAILQDDRNLDPPRTLSEIGVGAGYERDFRELGEFEFLAFYYDDELREDARTFINLNLGLTDTGHHKDFYGLNALYHFEAYHVWEALGVLDALNPDRGDGLYLFYQWIAGQDGDLNREGWYAQASWRISNPARWRFLRSIEPVVRYGELGLDAPNDPALPLTWSRRQWLLGTVLEMARGLYLRTEYALNEEATGAGPVDNDELLVQLLVEF